VTLTVTDSLGNRDEDERVITVNAPPDTTAPVADWTEPVPGSTVTERTVVLGATAADEGGSGLKQVQFRAKWGGEWRDLAAIDGAESPVAYAWDLCAATVPDGDVELSLQAVDHAGNASTSPTSRHFTKQFSCSPTVDPPPPAPAPAPAPPPAPVVAATGPRLDLSPRSGGRGQTVSVTVSGYQPGEEVTLMWDRVKNRNKKGKGKGKKGKKRPRIISVATATVSPSGHAVVVFQVPGEAILGGHPVEGLGSLGTHATTSFEVVSGGARAASVDATPVDNSADRTGTAGGTDSTLPGAAPVAILPDTSANDPSSGRKGPKRNGGDKHDRAGPDKKHSKNTKGGHKNGHREKGDKGGKGRNGNGKRRG
jgi:hypothetical protein